MKISFVIPCRNNLKYFKWAYDSIRKNQGNHEVFICAADDASTDGTKEAFQALYEIDNHFDYIVNEGPERVGHTILYDRIVNELVKTDIAIIFHADMYLCPGALDEIEKLLYEIDPSCGIEPSQIYKPRKFPNYKTIVSLTRIEPPLHPDGPEKYLADWGVEPEQFNETNFLQWFANEYRPKHDPPYTTGVFAPWAFFVNDFKEIGGHDKLFRPQSREDSLFGKSPIFVITSGIISVIHIEDLWNKYQHLAVQRPDGKWVIDTSNLELHTMAPCADGYIGESKLTGIIKHSVASDRLRRVVCRWGEVVVTDDHSLITTDLGGITPSECASETTLWKPAKFGEWSRRNFYKQINFNLIHKTDIENLPPLPIIENIDQYGNNEQFHNICEFLGFFCADGGASESGIIKISENDRDIVDYIADKSASLFGCNLFNRYRYEDHGNGLHVKFFNSIPMAKWLSLICGGRCHSKQVPEFIYNIPIVYQRSFLYGYLLGDGHLGKPITKNGKQIWVTLPPAMFYADDILTMCRWMSTSKSDILTTGIYYLLHRCFPNTSFRINFQAYKGNSGVWNIASTEGDFIKKTISIEPYVVPTDIVDVFDLEVRGDNTFIGGVGFIGLHNSDIFNRFKLNDIKFIQTWLGCVYHMTCRGSRFNPTLTTVGTNSREWETHNLKSMRNFIRKWGSVPMHDSLMDPIIPPKYKTAIVCKNLTLQMLYDIEIWGDIICGSDNDQVLFDSYIKNNQPLTDYDLSKKLVKNIDTSEYNVVVYLDCHKMTNADFYYLSVMSQMVSKITTVPAEYEIGNFIIKVNSTQSHESELIYIQKA